MYEDLHWLGLHWDEGLDTNGVSHGSFGPYSQSGRRSFYLDAWRKLRDSGLIYPCTCSRKDLERALSAPHEELLHGITSKTTSDRGPQPPSPAIEETYDTVTQPRAAAVQFPTEESSSQSPAAAVQSVMVDDELPYPGTCREKIGIAKDYDSPAGVSWRFKVPDGENVSFDDGYFRRQEFVAGRDFADFLLWRRDDIPAYQLAVVVDDAAMQITEVVRGADLVKSTARQLLLIRALGYSVPAYFHCPLLRDEQNVRLAKRHDALSLRKLRERGVKAEELRKKFADEVEWG
jgi:glutamyl-tRNA synthetase